VQQTVVLYVSGTFSVPIDIVGAAAFSALMKFDSYISHLSPKKRHLSLIHFVNIDKPLTESLIGLFTMHLRDYNQRLPADNGIQPNSPSDMRVTSDDDSYSESKEVNQSSPRNICSVCGKTDSSRNKFVDRQACSHRCCIKCKSQPCKKCNLLAHSRKLAQPCGSRRVVEVEVQNNSGTIGPGGISGFSDINTNSTVSSLSPNFRSRSNSFRGNHSRSSSRTATAAAESASSKRESSGKREQSTEADDEFSSRPLRRRSSSLSRDDRERYSEKRNAEKCVICMDKMTNPKKLDCGHAFCADCIDAAFLHAAKCPCCGRIFGKLRGNQPTGGTMKVRRSNDDLAGYRGAGSFVIVYDIPSGFQQVSYMIFSLSESF